MSELLFLISDNQTTKAEQFASIPHLTLTALQVSFRRQMISLDWQGPLPVQQGAVLPKKLFMPRSKIILLKFNSAF
jgi:hypothetical protein